MHALMCEHTSHLADRNQRVGRHVCQTCVISPLDTHAQHLAPALDQLCCISVCVEASACMTDEKRVIPPAMHRRMMLCTTGPSIIALFHRATGSGRVYRSFIVIELTSGLEEVSVNVTEPAFCTPVSPMSECQVSEVSFICLDSRTALHATDISGYPRARATTLSGRGTFMTQSECKGESASTLTLSSRGDHSVIREKSAYAAASFLADTFGISIVVTVSAVHMHGAECRIGMAGRYNANVLVGVISTMTD